MTQWDPVRPGGLAGGGAPDPRDVEFAPAGPGADEAAVLACPLCGGRFTHGGLACSSCPLSLGCEIVRCPGCGYQFPRRSRIVDLARRWLRYGAPRAR